MPIARLLRTLAYLKPSQVLWRARHTVERKVGLRRVPARPVAVGAWDSAALARVRDFAGRWGAVDARAGERAAAFRAGRFEFLHESADFAAGVDWQSTARARLWRYQLHYFDCAKELALSPAPGDAALAHTWMRDWIARNPPGTDVAWDAFTISARLMNWALAAAALGLDTDEMRASFLWQARYLSTHLERDVLANHLLKNGCALCVAGALLDPSLLEQGLALLRQQLEVQILPDGGHYERTPMYHALVLEDLLLVQAALGAKGDFLRPYIARMAHFLKGILHPDGEIAFFGDTVFGESRPPAVLLALAGHAPHEQPEVVAFSDSGFYIYRDPTRRMHLIAKAGAPGPAYQLGHAHGDCLSYELSVDGERIIVNCGVHGYADSPHRAWCRSEAAHNTFDVAGKPQLELWGAFRVGRRYALSKPPRVSPDGEVTAEVVVGGSVRSRRFHLHDNGLNITDEAAAGDELVTRIHLAPGMAWEPRGEAFAAVRSGKAMLLIRSKAISAVIESTPYFPEFGKELQSACLCLRGDASVAYEITLPG